MTAKQQRKSVYCVKCRLWLAFVDGDVDEKTVFYCLKCAPEGGS